MPRIPSIFDSLRHFAKSENQVRKQNILELQRIKNDIHVNTHNDISRLNALIVDGSLSKDVKLLGDSQAQ